MGKYLISFPADAMTTDAAELEAASHDSHEVIRAMKAAGVYVFGGGINEGVETVRVAADGTTTAGPYPGYSDLTGGFTVIETPTRGDAEHWAAALAAACRCEQVLHEFHYDPES